jgi:hypothetical protein
MTTSVRIRLSSSVFKLLLALALVVGVALMAATPALAQVSGQYAPPAERFVADIDRLEIDEDEGSVAPTSSGRVPVVGTTSSGGSSEASPTSSGRAPLSASSPASAGRAPLTASSPEAGKAEVAGKAKSGRSSVKGVLPATGGPLLPVILLAGLALVGTGMLVLRRSSGQE